MINITFLLKSVGFFGQIWSTTTGIPEEPRVGYLRIVLKKSGFVTNPKKQYVQQLKMD
jgi:hypothetical protein